MNPWARALISKGEAEGELPIYGSDEWDALAEADPRKIASCVRAAECWRVDGTEEAIRARIAEDDLLILVRERLASYDLAGAPWRRIHDIDAARRKAGDHRYRTEAT